MSKLIKAVNIALHQLLKQCPAQQNDLISVTGAEGAGARTQGCPWRGVVQH